MDKIKNKVLNVIHEHQRNSIKVPQMGFSEYFIQNVSIVPESYSTIKAANDEESETRSPDEEILQSIDPIYYKDDFDPQEFELQRLVESEFYLDTIDKNMKTLKLQQKVISKKVLQLILDQRNACSDEFAKISETSKLLQESIWTCKKTRSYLNFAKQQLTISSLEILASYRKRNLILNLLDTLRNLKSIKMTDQSFQQYMEAGEYSNAIKLLFDTKAQTEAYKQYNCIQSFSQKIQDTLLMTEVQLDEILNSLTQNFDSRKYTELQRAYNLLGKTATAMDRFHMNFISSIHSSAFEVLKSFSTKTGGEEAQKLVFEQLCDNIPAERYIECLIALCKAFWKILVCYNQVVLWHQTTKLDELGATSSTEEVLSNDEYVDAKLKKGKFRLWNDVQGKICLYINSSRIHQLKYEHFMQALAIMQRLKRVGLEFCDEPSEKLMETIQKQSVEFFDRYHRSCIEEITLFIDHEVWIHLTSFEDILQLQEYKNVKRALQRHQRLVQVKQSEEHKVLPLLPTQQTTVTTTAPVLTGNQNNDNDSSMSQDESSVYGSCNYFLRYNEKSSPFDGGFDAAMLEEDILAGIADESSCYYSEDSDDNNEQNLLREKNNGNEETNGDTENIGVVHEKAIIVNNSSLTVLRCIGRYLQMCRLLHSITPKIVVSMTELIDYFIFAVYELFSKDLPVLKDNLYAPTLLAYLNRTNEAIIPKVKKWPPSTASIKFDLENSEVLFGLSLRVVAVESCIHLIEQFGMLQGYLEHLLTTTSSTDDERQYLSEYCDGTKQYVIDLRKPVYMCSMARVVDIQAVLLSMTKVKWDVQSVTVEHSAYIDSIIRNIQTFSMRLDEIGRSLPLPRAAIWDNLTHVITHLLVEGFANAKKCTAGGRALMQLDFTHFMSLLELISGLKFPEHRSYVEQYVKAYYLPKDLLEEFVKTNSQYSTKHLTGLITCACINDKKTRQKLLGLLENLTNSEQHE